MSSSEVPSPLPASDTATTVTDATAGITSNSWKQSSASAYSLFDKLNSLNYYHWEKEMQVHLALLNQLSVVDGSAKALVNPGASATDEQKAKFQTDSENWKLCCTCAYIKIACRCKEEGKDQLEDKDPMSAWKKLKDLYGASVVGTQNVLHA